MGNKKETVPGFHEALSCKAPEEATTPCLSTPKETAFPRRVRSVGEKADSREAYMVGLTNPETKVTTKDDLNVKFPTKSRSQ